MVKRSDPALKRPPATPKVHSQSEEPVTKRKRNTQVSALRNPISCLKCWIRKVGCDKQLIDSPICQKCAKAKCPCIPRELPSRVRKQHPQPTSSPDTEASITEFSLGLPSPRTPSCAQELGKRKLDMLDSASEPSSLPQAKKRKRAPAQAASRCPSPCNDIRLMFASQSRLQYLRDGGVSSASSRSSSVSRLPSSAKDRKTQHLSLNEPCTTPWEAQSSSQHYSDQSDQLDLLLSALHKKQKIVVVAGAGISVAAGIPDFRSTNGLFNQLKSKHSLKSSGKDLFDASVYRHNSTTASFHEMVRTLATECHQAEPTQFHHLLNTLASQGRLMRLYTQNVDGLDVSLDALGTETPLPKKAPFPRSIQLHGSLSKMVCQQCNKITDLQPELFDGSEAPICQDCEEHDKVRQGEGCRSRGVGRLRPRMLLYNEFNPEEEAIGSCVTSDLRTRPDAVIVVGTTLKVPGVRKFVKQMVKVVNDRRDGVAIWINHLPEPKGADFDDATWDLVVQGNCEIIPQLMQRPMEAEDMGAFTEIQTEELDQVKASQGTLTIEIEARERQSSQDQEAGSLVAAQEMSPSPEEPEKAKSVRSTILTPTSGNLGKTSDEIRPKPPRVGKTGPKIKPGRPKRVHIPLQAQLESHMKPVKFQTKSESQIPVRPGKNPKLKDELQCGK